MRGAKTRIDLLRQCLSSPGDLERQLDRCMQGVLLAVSDEARGAVLVAVAEGTDTERLVRLFRGAPFQQETWRLLDQYDKAIRDRYWQEVVPQGSPYSEAELSEVIDRLLEAQRPHAAFHAVQLDWSHVETSRLQRLLRAVATGDVGPTDCDRLDPHRLSEALDSLDGRAGVSPDEMAQLEFRFITVLDYREHGLPNLERQMAASPARFVQVLALAFSRNDAGQDPPSWRIDNPTRRALLANAAGHLLHRIRCIPGTGQDGKINADALLNWLTEVRRLCAEHDRVEVGDKLLGALLSKAPADEDGSWPCLSVCEAMERLASQGIGVGFTIGVFNGRGTHSRGRDAGGGAEERELAAKYRGWAERRAFASLYVSTVLESIAVRYDRDAKREDTEGEVREM